MGWKAVDLDGTLAHYEHWVGPGHIGAPIAKMVDRVKQWIREGVEVRIFTARAFPIALSAPGGVIGPDWAVPMQHTMRGMECEQAIHAIRTWCAQHIGHVLPITCVKDFGMDEVYDDRAVQVEKNTGALVGYSTRDA